MAKMRQRCAALAEDEVIPRGSFRELAVTSGIVSIFRASAGVTGAELEGVDGLLSYRLPKCRPSLPLSQEGLD